MLKTENDEVMEVDIDYVTATETTMPLKSLLGRFGDFIVRQQADAGELISPWKMSGYRGLFAGPAAFGRRFDGACVRLSSNAAAQHWEQAVTLATNVSRIDLQITVRPNEGNARRLRRHYDSVRRKPHRRARPFKFKLWIGPTGPESLTIGRRISDHWLRIYDKGVESGLAHYKGALRYELELKRKPALRMALDLATSDDYRRDIARELYRFASDRNLQVGWSWVCASSVNEDTLQLCATLPTQGARVDRRLTWLRNGVAPAVHELIAGGRQDMVLHALGLSHLIPRGLDNLDQLVQLSEKEEVH